VEGKWKRRVARWFRLGLAVAGYAFLWMWLSGLYTSVGWDTEKAVDGRVLRSYYRIRWPGNGDLWVGGGAYYRPPGAGPVKPFDLASTSFAPPKHVPRPESVWNRLGWWWLSNPQRDPCDEDGPPRLVWGWWVAVPGWLPTALIGVWLAWGFHQRRSVTPPK
jgi:hypothetical protein